MALITRAAPHAAVPINLPTEIDASNQIAQSVTRFAIDPASIAGIPVNTPLGNNQLHYVEYFVLLEALAELNRLAGINPPQTAVVIMDIFVTPQNHIVLGNQNPAIPEIHSVVLWQQPQNQNIILIDPSSQNFSERLRQAYLVIRAAGHPNFIHNMIKGAIKPGKANLNNNGLYQGQGATTYIDLGSSAKRDCIDIAVKIAFEIQVLL